MAYAAAITFDRGPLNASHSCCHRPHHSLKTATVGNPHNPGHCLSRRTFSRLSPPDCRGNARHMRAMARIRYLKFSHTYFFAIVGIALFAVAVVVAHWSGFHISRNFETFAAAAHWGRAQGEPCSLGQGSRNEALNPVASAVYDAAISLMPGVLVSQESAEAVFWEPTTPDLLPQEQRAARRIAAVGQGIDILLLGDSVDRYLIEDSCSLYNGSMLEWAHDVIKYKAAVSPSGICRCFWGTIGFVHLYGARPTGPYLLNHVNNAQDPYTDTTLRIPFVLSHYNRSFGKLPDVVVYQANLWDAQQFMRVYNETDEREGVVRRYMADIDHNLDLVSDILPNSSVLLMRTTPTNLAFKFEGEFNAALRCVSQRKGIGLLDWDLMTSTVEPRASMFRDRTHPNPAHSRGFAATLVKFSTLLSNITEGFNRTRSNGSFVPDMDEMIPAEHTLEEWLSTEFDDSDAFPMESSEGSWGDMPGEFDWGSLQSWFDHFSQVGWADFSDLPPQ